jgi:hypothetical protein
MAETGNARIESPAKARRSRPTIPASSPRSRNWWRRFGIEAVSAGELGLPSRRRPATPSSQCAHQGHRRGEAPACRRFADDSGLVGRCARRRAGHLLGALGRRRKDFMAAMRGRGRGCRRAAPRRPATAPRISSPRCASPGPTASRGVRGEGRRHAGLAAARRQGLRLRSDVPARRPRRTFGEMTRGEARPAPPGKGACRTAPAFAKFVECSGGGCRTETLSHNVDEPRSNGSFGVYVHWPFCAAKCPYCDFNSHVRTRESTKIASCAPSPARSRRTAAPRPAAPCSDLPRRRHAVADGPATVGAVLDAIAQALDGRASTPRSRWRPIRPASRPTRFRGYRAAGVNRVSLGVQALDDAALKPSSAACTRARGARRGRDRRSRSFRALLRPDLCPAAPDRRRCGRTN